MATSNSTQILIDTNKRVVIKRVGVFDAAGGDEAKTVMLDATSLSGTLDANGRLWRSGNTLPAGFGANALTVIRMNYMVDAEVGHVQVKWEGNSAANDRTIFAVGVGNGDTNPMGNIPSITNNAINPTGNILVQTFGTTANAAYTLILELHKNSTYYDIGVFRDPAAFNYGDYSLKP
jgi:hypothetical protein